MVMSWIWTGILFISFFSARLSGSGPKLASAVLEGAQAGMNLSITMAGSICLWSALGTLMSDAGITGKISSVFSPLLGRIFPSGQTDRALGEDICANFCANLLGLGNAATPMGIRAVKRMAKKAPGGSASGEMCRLVVLNTASIQLIPGNVAALRASLGCAAPFDLLGAVWVSSACSAALGLAAAWIFGKLWPDA